MIRKAGLVLVFAALTNGTGALAGEPIQASPSLDNSKSVGLTNKTPKKDFEVPFSGFFAGVGVSRSYYNFTNLDSYSQGVSKGYSLVYSSEYTGAASGSTNTGLLNGASNSSPAAQLGYFQKFSKTSPWVWGVKLPMPS